MQNKKVTAYRATSVADKRRWVSKLEAAASHYLVRTRCTLRLCAPALPPPHTHTHTYTQSGTNS
jgi:hypothetical protein